MAGLSGAGLRRRGKPRIDLHPDHRPAVRQQPVEDRAARDRENARRILEELVENALAFSPEEEAVTVSVSVIGGSTEVRVTDRGSGVDAAMLARIFDPLEQGEELNTRTHQGVGLGLTLARTSARAMDGDVTLEQTGPGGSTFLWTVSRTRPSAL